MSLKHEGIVALALLLLISAGLDVFSLWKSTTQMPTHSTNQGSTTDD